MIPLKYILKGIAVGSLFAAGIGALLALGPSIVNLAERAEAKKLAYELIDSIHDQLPGQPGQAHSSVSERMIHFLTEEDHLHWNDEQPDEADTDFSHHFGEMRGYAVFDTFGRKLQFGGRGLVGGSRHIRLTGGLEAAIINGRHSVRILQSDEGVSVYRNFIPLLTGEDIVAVSVVDIEANGVKQLVVQSVRAASIAAATVVGCLFTAVLLVLMRAGQKMKRAERRASYLANFDPLTQLRNRRSLETEVLALESGDQVCLFIADIDDFKQINDKYGHLAGDMVIKEVADAMRTHSGTPLLARWAGDEFVGLCNAPLDPQERAAGFAKLQDAVNEPIQIGETEVSCTLSIGSTVGVWSDGAFDRLLHQADLALLAAKRQNGRGVHAAHTKAMDTEDLRERKIAERLEIAIAERGFSLAYQPQYDAVEKQLRGFEVLLRWQDAYLGNVSPATFIPIAEQSDQILHIGDWVMREACKNAATWPTSCQVSVNVSAFQIAQPEFVAKVQSALSASGLDPSRLELEITETALLGRNDQVHERLTAVAAMGVGLALDDFGTGHSTLTYLTSLPITKLKIDRSFVSEVGDDGPNDAVITAIVGLAKSLKMSVIAEGVETSEQSARITSMGCSNIQGYLYGKPVFEPFSPNSELSHLTAELKDAFVLKRA